MKARPPVSRAELLAVLSLVSDLGMGLPMEHALRQCLIAMRLGERMGLGDKDREAMFCAALLAWVGCHVDAYEQARWFGDDHVVKADIRKVDVASTFAELAFTFRHVGQGQRLPDRMRTMVGFLTTGLQDAEAMLTTHCKAANDLATGLGLGERVCVCIEQSFERWDGLGDPHGAKGTDILLMSRLVNLADVVEVYHAMGGTEAAVQVARERSGTQFDPAVVEAFVAAAPELFRAFEETPTWETVVDAEPRLAEPLPDDELEAALEAIADFVDLKSPYTLGHSRAVADLAGAAATTMGLPDTDATLVRRAGLVHDLGRVGVPNTIWDKPGELTLAEQERVRLHPYLTGRTLAASSGLASLGAVAAQHHERLDGSGYPQGLRRDAISVPAQVLAAADMYHAKTEPRPHRPAMAGDEAAATLRAEVRSGRLDGDAVEAVLGSAGHRSRRRRDSVAGLTPREVEVLRLLARGLPTKQIARELGITRKTAANHVEHIYTKTGASNRALASLFASKHGLVGPDPASDQVTGLP